MHRGREALKVYSHRAEEGLGHSVPSPCRSQMETQVQTGRAWSGATHGRVGSWEGLGCRPGRVPAEHWRGRE